jgi:hypothetical protein
MVRTKIKTQSESVTLRIEKNILEELHKEAEQKLESLNTLANQILKQYVYWYSHAAEAGMMYSPKPLLIRIMDKLTEEQINQVIDEHMKNDFYGMANMLIGGYNISSYLDNLESWMSASDIHHRHDVNDGIHTYIIHHGMGKNWCYFFERFFKALFKDMKLKYAEVKATDDTIVFKVNVE